ncbi:MAG TPA: hypothetical protein VJY63_11110 [Marinospirillum sp.]|uniref:hypothetical protein n=1 Tax=Marinospirillum sp. TaxID=2183934 RepID=UPI002B4886A7|nr:hypothetical protein [Marinospirillum sp.]HKM16450.1 hypothetical protein [Marinospirillum sp.]
MKHLFKMLLIALLTTTLLGCIAQPQPKKPQRPAWMDNPRAVGDIVGLGQAGFHFNGKAAQRELATSRALDEIARQMGVTVSSIMVINQQHTSMGSSTNMAATSEQSVKGSVVNAVVHDEWLEGDTLYIIMVGR